ncbi:hypothetical protein DPMN_177829 [Dreissena polymorpha]|uniref:Uncharacterized protein n=1 Tax=Dreissena polymorpha TaxID=45954 RepID=A0A9D4II53_DREPO|nr:hypothetical protein DPMN_177829 [Dreissena polymorpha]
MLKTRAGLYATLFDTLTLETITAVGKHFRMPTILERFKERRTQMSHVCTVRQELGGQVPTLGSRENCKKEGLVKCYRCGFAVRIVSVLFGWAKT